MFWDYGKKNSKLKSTVILNRNFWKLQCEWATFQVKPVLPQVSRQARHTERCTAIRDSEESFFGLLSSFCPFCFFSCLWKYTLLILWQRKKSLRLAFRHKWTTEIIRSPLIKPIQQPTLNLHDEPGIVEWMKVREGLMYTHSEGAHCIWGRMGIFSSNCYMHQERCKQNSR